jgi:predicted transcriptional regulator
MKTAVSIPDHVFASADALAEKLGLTRSALYATALSEFLARYSPDDVTEQLNAIYSTERNGDTIDLHNAAARTLRRNS